jgi:hypothetical protein
MWSSVTFSLPPNVAVPLYVNAETIPITIEIATRTANDINRYLSDEGRFCVYPEERRLRFMVLVRGWAVGDIPWLQAQRNQRVLSYPTTGWSPSVVVIHPRPRSWVGRKGPRRNMLGVAQDRSVSVLVPRRLCPPSSCLPGAIVRSWKKTFFSTQLWWARRWWMAAGNVRSEACCQT